MPSAGVPLPVPAAYPAGVPREIEVPDEPLGERLVSATVRFPNRVAVDYFGRRTTYRQLSAEVARAAQVLVDVGVRAGDRVAIVLPNCTAHVVELLLEQSSIPSSALVERTALALRNERMLKIFVPLSKV